MRRLSGHFIIEDAPPAQDNSPEKRNGGPRLSLRGAAGDKAISVRKGFLTAP
jgi:hypothetical protein